ncbi:MAG: GNAT family N-acetyltransferase [Chitinophagales bacterium]
MNFPQNLILEDDRVLLRPLQNEDLQLLLPFAMNEPEIWKFSIRSPAGKEGMQQYIQETIDQRNAGKEYPFIIFDKTANAWAGSSRFYDIQLSNGMTQLGYTWYGKQFQRTGLNRHCKLLMLGFAFETWGMERVEFRADVKNERSVRAMKEIGCIEEGVLRSQSPLATGGRRDAIVLSILKTEWINGGKEKLLAKIHP